MGEQTELAGSDLERLVRHRLAAQIGAAVVGEMAVDDRFDELGVDSMKIVLVLAGLERDLAVERITEGELSEVGASIGTIVDHLVARAGNRQVPTGPEQP
jgi:acyl carrier protein